MLQAPICSEPPLLFAIEMSRTFFKQQVFHEYRRHSVQLQAEIEVLQAAVEQQEKEIKASEDLRTIKKEHAELQRLLEAEREASRAAAAEKVRRQKSDLVSVECP